MRIEARVDKLAGRRRIKNTMNKRGGEMEGKKYNRE